MDVEATGGGAPGLASEALGRGRSDAGALGAGAPRPRAIVWAEAIRARAKRTERRRGRRDASRCGRT